MKNLFLYIILIIGFLTSCKRYEEGGITLRTVNNRLYGRWKLTGYNSTYDQKNDSILQEYYENQTFSAVYADSLYEFPFEMSIVINEDSVVITNSCKKKSEPSNVFPYNYIRKTYTKTNSWSWFNGTEKKEIISTYNLLGLDWICYYKIIKLTNKELIIESEYDKWYYSGTERYVFEKVD